MLLPILRGLCLVMGRLDGSAEITGEASPRPIADLIHQPRDRIVAWDRTRRVHDGLKPGVHVGGGVFCKPSCSRHVTTGHRIPHRSQYDIERSHVSFAEPINNREAGLCLLTLTAPLPTSAGPPATVLAHLITLEVFSSR